MQATRTRRFLRYSLRTFLLAMTIVAIWLSDQVNKANRQRRAVEAIGQCGQVVYWHEHPAPIGVPGSIDYFAEPPGPRWLRKLLGDHYFQDVRSVSFSPDDKLVETITSLKTIDQLAIDGYQLNDEAFKNLASLPKLKWVSIIRGPGLTNQAVMYLCEAKSLEIVNINQTPVTVEVLRHLAKLPKLRQLTIGSTLISEKEVRQFQAYHPDMTVVAHGEPYRKPSGSLRPRFTSRMHKSTEMKRARLAPRGSGRNLHTRQ